MEFRRNTDKYGIEEKDVNAFLKANQDVLAMPGTDSLRFYYEGKPITRIEEGIWYKFPDSYNKYIKKQLSNDTRFWDYGNNKKEFYMNPQIVGIIKNGMHEGLKIDRERKSGQVIALKHQTYDADKYSICDMEATIPKGDLKGTTRGEGKHAEIDFIAICPKKKSILLIEYKCQQSAVTAGMRKSLQEWNVKMDKNRKEKGEQKNIVAHFKDYLAVLESCRNDAFVKELIGAYNFLAQLKRKPEIIMDDPCEIQKYVQNMKLLFLFTNKPKEGILGSKNLTKNTYENTKRYLKQCIDMYKKELECRKSDMEYLSNAQSALCLAAVSPESVSLDEGFCSIDELAYPE